MDKDTFLRTSSMIRKKALIPNAGASFPTPSSERKANSIADRSNRGVYRSEIKHVSTRHK